MMASPETGPQAPTLASDADFENCKGQCGATPWCRACQEELKKMIHEADRKKMEERESIFNGAR
ncbi:MAG: hypothetical protein C0394_01560 [Syntrophus sp. (in: bacteria)]|nr:hypothetical protein [Syntrophus sp. (in: bacteria)]